MNQDPQSPAPAMSSVRQDLKNVSENGGASVRELQDFLGQLRGKSPKEMLGVIAGSRLVGSTLLATFLVALLVGLFTAIPFAKKNFFSKPKAIATIPVLTSDPNAAKEAEPDSAATTGTDTDPKPASPEDPPPADDLLDTLGIGETKVSPLDVNPLDGGDDDLFNDLDK